MSEKMEDQPAGRWGPGREEAGRTEKPRPRDLPRGQDRIEGRNPVIEALKGPRKVHLVYVAKGVEKKGAIFEIYALCKARKVRVREVDRQYLAELAVTAAPQGVVADLSEYRFSGLKPLLEKAARRAEASGGSPFIIVLDGVEDPGNFGAVLRVADATGADGVVIAKKRSAPVTAAVAKASAGALEHVRIALVPNLAGALETMKEQGLWIVGADSGVGSPYYEVDMTGPTAIVVGSEGSGISRLVRERCDFLVHLPMRGQVTSLNVSTAASALAYDLLRQRSVKEHDLGPT